MEGVTIPYDALWGAVGFAIQMGVLVATLAVWGAKIDARLKAVEAHGEKVDEVYPLKASFEGFKSEIERRFSDMKSTLDGTNRKVDEVHTLLLRAAAVSAGRAKPRRD